MKDIDPAEMDYLLQFIYMGEVDIPSADLERLVKISKDLGIVGMDAVTDKEAEGKRASKAAKRKLTPSRELSKKVKVEADVDTDSLYDEDEDFIDECPNENDIDEEFSGTIQTGASGC